jgi:hypothetical protein
MGRTGFFQTLLAMALSCFMAGLPALAQSTASSLQRKVASAVARDLHLVGEDETGHLQVLAPPAMSLPARAELHVVSVRPGFSPESWLVRVDCAARSDCLPFHVVLLSPSTGVRNRAGDERLRAAVQARDASTQTKQVRAPLARSGDRMRLVEERPGMRLQARVVCLESGALGDAIRVRNLATHRVLLATVAGKDEVRVE